MFNDYELEQKANKIEELRKEVKANKKCMEYYEYLKELNRNDIMYGWLFTNNDMLEEDLYEFSTCYQKPYVLSVMQVYINELENIILKTRDL